jgi:hypothetical protein
MKTLSANAGGNLIVVNTDYAEVSGLTIIGARDQLPRFYGDNGIADYNSNTRLLCNEVSQTNHCGLKNLSSTATGQFFEGNFLHDIGRDSEDHGMYVGLPCTIRRNLVMNAMGNGIQDWSSGKGLSYDPVIDHNIFAGNSWSGIVIENYGAKIFNNVLFKNNQKGSTSAGGISFSGTSYQQANVAVNNLAYETREYINPLSPPATYDYNARYVGPDVDNPATTWTTKSGYGTKGAHNIISSAPGFVGADSTNLDFLFLPPDSDLIDKGDYSLLTGLTDVNGNPVTLTYSGSAPDIGITESAPVPEPIAAASLPLLMAALTRRRRASRPRLSTSSTGVVYRQGGRLPRRHLEPHSGRSKL